MEITQVRVNLVKKPSGSLVGFANVTFDDCFAVNSIRIINGRNGLFVAMPSGRFCPECMKSEEADPKRAWKDIAHPITGEFRQQINDAVLNAYEAAGQTDAPF